MRAHRSIRNKFPRHSAHHNVPRNGVHAGRVDPDTGRMIYMEDEIMESILGRKLGPNEGVRFKNGNALDCRRANLELEIRPQNT